LLVLCILCKILILLYNCDCNLSPLFLYTGALIFVVHSVGTFSSIHIILFRLCSLSISICPPFLQSLIGMLSLPDALLFLGDYIAISMSNAYGGLYSSYFLVSISFVHVLLWEVLCSAVVSFRS